MDYAELLLTLSIKFDWHHDKNPQHLEG